MLKLVFSKNRYPACLIEQPRLLIGRDPRNSLVLDAPGISGFHAEIHMEGDQLFMVDLDSTNGTFVNRRRITGRQGLKPWDSVRFDEIEAEIQDSERVRPTLVNPAILAGDDHPSPKAWSLMGESAPVLRKTFPLSGKAVIGRDATCAVRIDSDAISRFHAELEFADELLVIRDLESANGTFVNGQKITQTHLKPGDKVALDRIVLRVEGPVLEIKTMVRPVDLDRVKTVILDTGDIAALEKSAQPGKAPGVEQPRFPPWVYGLAGFVLAGAMLLIFMARSN